MINNFEIKICCILNRFLAKCKWRRGLGLPPVYCTTTFILNKTKKKKGWLGRCAGPETETQYRAQRNEEELNFAVGGINDPALSDRKTYRAPWTSASIRRILNSACTVPFKSMNSKYLKMFSPFILRLLHSTSRERSYLESRYYDDINTKDVY